MKTLRTLPVRLIASVLSFLRPDPQETPDEESSGKTTGLLRLHEYQHRVIVEVFRISIAGFAAFTFILSGFSLYLFTDIELPVWMGLLVSLLGICLLTALFRTVQEFRNYRNVYQDVTTKLQQRLAQSTKSASDTKTPRSKKSGNHLLSNLKPNEYKGWDNKACEHCQKQIEMLADVCQHCGHDQDVLLTN